MPALRLVLVLAALIATAVLGGAAAVGGVALVGGFEGDTTVVTQTTPATGSRAAPKPPAR